MKNRMLKLPRSCGVDASLALPVLIGSAGNIGCVVGVVLMNKYMQLAHDFDHLVFLSFCHFAFTAVGTRVVEVVACNFTQVSHGAVRPLSCLLSCLFCLENH